ncbi:MAG: hypothetical protein ACTMH4_14270 [Sphingobacterium sp.]
MVNQGTVSEAHLTNYLDNFVSIAVSCIEGIHNHDKERGIFQGYAGCGTFCSGLIEGK